ncbi:MAG: transporter substrate-binding protein [Clostridia bacterium]|jgi:multiple sugar transport system substrate-binding protein|nr:transporter substrate-binding protein [Clostridia bacterium]
MKLFKKKWVTGLLTATLLGTTLVGCSSPANSSNAPKSEEGTIKKEVSKEEGVKEKGKEEKVLVWTNNRHDAEYMQQVVADFNKKHEGEINIEFVINTDNYINLITMGISSNQAPDIFCTMANQFDLKSFADSNIIQPLNPYITEEFKQIYDLKALSYEAINTLGEDIYYVPTAQRSGNRLIYNKELFQKAGIAAPPKTLPELVEMAKKITEVGGGVQYGVGMPGQSFAFSRLIEPSAQVSGVGPYDYVNGKYDFSGYKPFIEATRQMFTEGSMIPGAATMKVDPLRVQFSEGNIGMYSNASQEVGVLTDQFPAKMEWGVAEIPSLDGQIKGALSALPQVGWAMTTTVKNPEAAWKVIEYLSSLEVMVGYVEKGYSLPSSSVVMEKVDQSKISKLAEFGKKDYESVYPQFPQVTPQGKGWKDVLWEACLPTDMDIDKTLEELTKSYNEALDAEVKMGKVKRLIIKDYDPLNFSNSTYTYLNE